MNKIYLIFATYILYIKCSLTLLIKEDIEEGRCKYGVCVKAKIIWLQLSSIYE
jgi:hypothetical protein